jgi:hypothetical protein
MDAPYQNQAPVVGQTLFSLNVNNAARGCLQELTEMVVTTVGRKYFTCKAKTGWPEFTYHIDGWRQKSDFSPVSVLYLNKLEYVQQAELDQMHATLAKHFQWLAPRLPADVIKKMYACLPPVSGPSS